MVRVGLACGQAGPTLQGLVGTPRTFADAPRKICPAIRARCLKALGRAAEVGVGTGGVGRTQSANPTCVVARTCRHMPDLEDADNTTIRTTRGRTPPSHDAAQQSCDLHRRPTPDRGALPGAAAATRPRFERSRNRHEDRYTNLLAVHQPRNLLIFTAVPVILAETNASPNCTSPSGVPRRPPGCGPPAPWLGCSPVCDAGGTSCSQCRPPSSRSPSVVLRGPADFIAVGLYLSWAIPTVGITLVERPWSGLTTRVAWKGMPP